MDSHSICRYQHLLIPSCFMHHSRNKLTPPFHGLAQTSLIWMGGSCARQTKHTTLTTRQWSHMTQHRDQNSTSFLFCNPTECITSSIISVRNMENIECLKMELKSDRRSNVPTPQIASTVNEIATVRNFSPTVRWNNMARHTSPSP